MRKLLAATAVTIGVLASTGTPASAATGGIPLVKPIVGFSVQVETTVAGDFDGDGRPDLVIASVQVDTTTALGDLDRDGDLDAIVAAQVETTAAGDFDGDGRDDLAIYSTTAVEIHLDTRTGR